ncbi:MAG: LemA family protein [Candidatus Margulisbacteria bacterium]|jgi:LemA protein|nr:LemA family protein [Candidatus Margulisiibacteriota bacterium]
MAKANYTIWYILGGIVLALFIIYSFFAGAYNSFVSLNNSIESQWAQVENQLQRRNDLIPNLVNTVKGYASHEKEIFTDIANARALLAGARTTSEKVQANNEISGALSRLLMIAENYPALQANKNFLALQDQLEGTENRIAVERQRYNESVRRYNDKSGMFPGNILARLYGFAGKKPYIETPRAAQAVPAVQF